MSAADTEALSPPGTARSYDVPPMTDLDFQSLPVPNHSSKFNDRFESPHLSFNHRIIVLLSRSRKRQEVDRSDVFFRVLGGRRSKSKGLVNCFGGEGSE